MNVAATGYAFDVPYLPGLAARVRAAAAAALPLSGPGAQPEAAAARFSEQLAASPRTPVDPADLEALSSFGSEATSEAVAGSLPARA